jgi:hypothetical protein
MLSAQLAIELHRTRVEEGLARAEHHRLCSQAKAQAKEKDQTARSGRFYRFFRPLAAAEAPTSGS